MKIYARTKDGESMFYDVENSGDVVILELTERDKEHLKNMGTATTMAFFMDDMPFESFEDVLKFVHIGQDDE